MKSTCNYINKRHSVPTKNICEKLKWMNILFSLYIFNQRKLGYFRSKHGHKPKIFAVLHSPILIKICVLNLYYFYTKLWRNQITVYSYLTVFKWTTRIKKKISAALCNVSGVSGILYHVSFRNTIIK